ncbi:group II intron reverse transcriptase/maturase [Chitinophaga sancti]|uniref:Group II intron reverse transcriptase/maturase n=1 Tax=Chitinophaga sancti TaxID=1004 RepID=A0A1K1SC96_9BACT|nr:group II intron reverse transcriptase/maturase [Chitinophaga sancti]WQD63600.1 group II intron reverse transcriptase/maturase [Chitinophaga sancti]WQG90775.1 group II intron reverse transcriptase/maturase [Chitinophaga sancti]SFW81968.1 group II intron reverse transcriptase/maturase [Chitinophaga sancti]
MYKLSSSAFFYKVCKIVSELFCSILIFLPRFGIQYQPYHAKPVRRVYIPKADGKQRPIGVTVLEDKIVQRATAMVLNAIYEADFLGFSYGFRPKRSQHQALDAVYAGLLIKRINWILDADIQNFFGKVNHGWVLKFVEHRIADPRVLRLIRKWLNAGVMENGVLSFEEDGTPQGGSISPLIANIYLHYVLDLWTQNMREKQLKGDVIVARYADDSITGFQYKSEAEYYLQDLRLRLAKFGLSLNEEKTRLLEFGKYAISRRKEQGSGKPETFNFLGFTHICGKSRKGKFTILRYTINKRMRSKMLSIKQQLRKRMHMKVSLVGKWLTSVLTGYFRYYGVSGNIGKLDQFRYGILMRWFKILKRRSQQRRLSWSQMSTIANRWLPRPKVYYKHPLSRIGVTT